MLPRFRLPPKAQTIIALAIFGYSKAILIKNAGDFAPAFVFLFFATKRYLFVLFLLTSPNDVIRSTFF